MVFRDELGIDMKFDKASISTYKIVKSGDYVIHLRSFQGGFAFSRKEGICSPAYTILRPNNKVSFSFFENGFTSKKFVDSLRIVTYGIRDGRSISVEEWLRLKSCFPSKAEQTKISRLLSMIDYRILTQSKLIEDLQQLKSALYQRVFSSMHRQAVALSNIADIIKGKQINGTELFESGDYYVMNGGIVPSGYYNDFNTPANTISISEGGNSCGYVQFNDVPFWSGGHCYTLQIKSDQIDLRYLFHFLKHREQDIMALRIGSGLPNIQKKDLERFQILIPYVDEQQRCAIIFDCLQHKEDIEVSILNQWQQQKQYLLGQMFI